MVRGGIEAPLQHGARVEVRARHDAVAGALELGADVDEPRAPRGLGSRLLGTQGLDPGSRRGEQVVNRLAPGHRGATVLRSYTGSVASERQIHVGGVPIGGGAPVVVQTMTKTETANLSATMDQIRRVADAGADVVRVAVPRDQDVEALKTIVVDSPIPVIADIHFNHTLAIKAIEAGAHCVRLNPGNIGGPDKVAQVVDVARRHRTPMRIGVNSGSLPK